MFSIKDYYEHINSTIDSYISKKRNVLIHCVYGVTRSCSCAIGYCIWKDRCTYDEAYSVVKSNRPECDIPWDYECYLREYSHQYLNGKTDPLIDRECYNHVMSILCGTGSATSLLKCLYEFEESHPYCRFGAHMDCDSVYTAKRFSVGSFIREDIDLDVMKTELEPFLTQFDLYNINFD